MSAMPTFSMYNRGAGTDTTGTSTGSSTRTTTTITPFRGSPVPKVALVPVLVSRRSRNRGSAGACIHTLALLVVGGGTHRRTNTTTRGCTRSNTGLGRFPS